MAPAFLLGNSPVPILYVLPLSIRVWKSSYAAYEVFFYPSMFVAVRLSEGFGTGFLYFLKFFWVVFTSLWY